MAEVVIAHGGTVNEFIGDAVFAIFGAPIAHPDHAERSAAAAIAMQSAMVEINAAHAVRGLPRFEMGIGINTGEAVVGNIGSEQRAKYTVVGNAVNVAARVESSTVGGQIFVSAATYEKIRDLAEVTGPVPVQVKGVSEPLLLYELRAIKGRFAQRLPEMSTDADPQAAVTLPIACHVIDGKVVRPEGVAGTVVRLGPRHLDARIDAVLAPLTNLKLRLNYPGLGFHSADLYGKVVPSEHAAAAGLTRIRLTSVEAADQKAIETIVADAR
jgi:adenylate cyclase